MLRTGLVQATNAAARTKHLPSRLVSTLDGATGQETSDCYGGTLHFGDCLTLD